MSLASARTISNTLEAAGHDVRPWTIRLDGTWAAPPTDQRQSTLQTPGVRPVDGAARFLAEIASVPGPVVVYPTLHGAPGEDGSIAGLCGMAGLRLAGSPVAASAAAIDKWVTKQVAAATGVATAPCTLLGPSDTAPPVTQPTVVKPATGGSSHGVCLVLDDQEMIHALSEARSHSTHVLLEPYINAREVDIALFDDGTGQLVVLPPLEVHHSGLFDTSTKYDGTARFTVPAILPAQTTKELSQAAQQIYRALGCWGIVRIDFFVTETQIILNEVNTAPGMSSRSQVPQMAVAHGWSLDQLLNRLVAAARFPGVNK